jgi:hypothetical protein
MAKRGITHSFVITALTLILGCDGNVVAQKPKSETISFPTLLRMLADQPDHMADRTLVVNDSVMKMKFAKKQDRIRQEFYPLDQAKNESYRDYKIITISKLNQPTIVFDPQEKTYAEASEDFKMVSFDIEELLKNASAELGKIKAESAGIETMEGHEASKIRITFEGSTEEMYFYFANGLKNLFVKMDSGTIKQIKGSYTVSNVLFDVPDELFEIPKNYKRVDFNSMISAIRQKALK